VCSVNSVYSHLQLWTGSFQLNRGFRQARQLLVDIARLGLPAGCLYLASISPHLPTSPHTSPYLQAGCLYLDSISPHLPHISPYLQAGCLYLDSISPQFIALEAEHASLRAGVRYCAAYIESTA